MTNNPQNVLSYTLPPPVQGLNYLDPIDNMSPASAREMLNFFPDNESVKLRKGSLTFATVAGGDPVVRLNNLVLATGAEKLVAMLDNKFYEVSTGTASDITGSTTPTSNLWQTLIFKNRLFAVNGANAPQVYTGSGNFADASFTGSGLTAADVINIGAFKGKVYLVEKDTASVWYAALGAVTGATTELDLSSEFLRGGYLMAVGSFPDPTGNIAQDLWLAVSSEGEVLLYAGTDPGETDWVRVARYYIAKPIGRRCLLPYDNDVLILTRRGLIPVSGLFQGDEIGQSGIAARVNKYIREAAAGRADLDGWHGMYSADQRRLILNMPIGESTSEQLVCNVDTQAWCRYNFCTCEPPTAWSVFGSDIYYGGVNGKLIKIETGESDDGMSITADLLWAWNYMGARGNYKRFTDARPLIVGTEVDSLGIKMETDYNLTANPAKTINGTGAGAWGAEWGSPWGAATITNFKRYGLASQGHAGALRVFGTFKDVKAEINAVEVRFETGGQI